jgi:dienelactone hydrolase
LLEGVDSPETWEKKRRSIERRFLELIRDEAAPDPPEELSVEVESEWDAGDFRIRYISYQVESDERAHAYLAVPNAPAPEDGFPGVVCLHGTTNWGARRTLGLPPEPGDPHAGRASVAGKDYARQLAARGYVTLSPEHFCAAARVPPEGPYETAAFYRKHPDWSAVGQYVYDSRIACSLLAARPEVNAARLGVTGHSLGGHGSIWLAACDDRIRCAAPSCSGPTFRENPQPLVWSRDHWYVYFPQLREEFLSGRRIPCDFHEMMALIAPRPLLERFALNDGDPTGQNHRAMLHLRLHELYRLLGCEQAHAFVVFGDGHFIPDLSRESMLGWMDRWLKYDGGPLGAWDARPTRTA